MIYEWTKNLIAFLNEAAAIDPVAIRSLISHHVPCNPAMQAHESIQTGGTFQQPTVGMLGMLNGFCGTIPNGRREGWGPIAAILEDSGGIHFIRTEELDE